MEVLAPPQPRSFIAVVCCADSLFGLEADEIRKFVHPIESEFSSVLMNVGADPNFPPLFPKQFWDNESSGPVGVLDVEALLRRPGVRFTPHTAPQVAASTVSDPEQFLHLALFKVEGRTFAVEVSYVRQALFGDKITPAENMGAVLFGHYLAADQQTPILRLLEFLGLPSLGGEVNPQRGLVIGNPASEAGSTSATVGFLIENVVGAIKAPISQLHSLAQSGLPHAPLYSGVLSNREHGYVIVLDGAALLSEIQAPASLRTSSKQQAGNPVPSVVQEDRVSFLVYRTGGGTLASPLEQIEAVVPLPEFFPLGRPGDSFLGVMRWRGHNVNLFDMAALTGQPGNPGHSPKNVLIVTGGTYYGFLVTEAESVTSTVAQPSPLLSRPKLAAGLSGRNAELTGKMIQIPNGPARGNVTVLELKLLLDAMTVETSV